MKRAAFIALMLVGLLAFIETVGALVYFLRFTPEQRRLVEATLGLADPETNPVTRYRPHPYFNYVGNPDYRTPDGDALHGPLGIRVSDAELFAKPRGVFRVVALGGSTTYGMYFRDGDNVWPALVQAGLRVAIGPEVEVVNAGLPNYTTFELLGVASMWLPELEPDLVLLHTGLNDAFAVGFPDEGGPDNTAFRFSWTHRPMPAAARLAMRRSYMLRAIGAGWLSRSGFQVGDMANAMQRPVPPLPEVRDNVRQASGKYFRRNLETLIALIRHAGAEPVLVDMPLDASVGSAAGEYYDAVTAAVIRNNRILAEVGGEQGVTVVELHARVRDPELFMDVAHMSQAGMLLKAKLVAEAIVPVVRRLRRDAAAASAR